MSELEELQRVLARERLARKEAERILEERSLVLFQQKQEIEILRQKLLEDSRQRTTKLNRTQELLNDIFELHPFSIIIYSPDSLRILEANKTAQIEYGYDRSTFLEMQITDLHPSQERNSVRAYISQLDYHQPSANNWTHVRKNDTDFMVRITGTPITFRDMPARIVIVENITETIHLQRSRDQERQKYMDFVERSSDSIFRISSMGTFSYVNAATCQITGYQEDELLGMYYSQLVRQDYVKRVIAFYQFQLQSDTANTYTEFPIVAKNGNEIWLGLNVDVHLDDNGEKEVTAIAREITERKVMEKALLRSEEKYRSIIENMQLGLLELDKEGIIRKAYPTFCQIVGYSPEEIEGTKGLFMLDEQAMMIMEREQEKRARGEKGLYEIKLLTKGGEHRWVLISGAPFYDENNRFVGTIGIHLDITDRKLLEGELRNAKTLAESSLRSKELFLANVSHEIRTPLNAIIGLSELLKESDLADAQVEMTNTICKASHNLLELINDILLLSKADVGEVQLRKGIYSLHVICSDAFDLFVETAKQKGLDYRLELSNDTSMLFELDRLRVSQILQNLLSNAIKFTNEGSVVLKLEWANESDNIRIEISDTGIGIPAEDLDIVFKDFAQASNNRVEQYGGTGLGLPIVQKLVELMSGSLEVCSTHYGTDFIVELPLKTVKEGVNHETPAVHVKAPEIKRRVLVAEDNRVNQLLISKILDKWGYDYVTVEDGTLVVEAINREKFDIILMDVRMPKMDGMDATRIIRDDLMDFDIAILGLTANAQAGDEVDYLNVGMNAVLGKPFAQNDLFERMEYCIIGQRAEALARLEHIAPEDKDFTEYLRMIFIEDTTLRLSKIEEAIHDQDASSIASIVHSMKPSLYQLSIQDLNECVRRIEKVEQWSDEFEQNVRVFKRRCHMLVQLFLEQGK